MTDSGDKSAWMVHESKGVSMYVHDTFAAHSLYVPRVSGSVKNLYNNKNIFSKKKK